MIKEYTPTKIMGLYTITPSYTEDYRGSYLELYDSKNYEQVTLGLNFVQDDISTSRKDVLRGIHGDFKTYKLVTVLHGSVYTVIVDNRPGSSTYHKWYSCILSSENKTQLLIPPGCGNSILALTDDVIYHYKQTEHYTPFQQFTLRWDDPELAIVWPIKNPILSQRDASGDYV